MILSCDNTWQVALVTWAHASGGPGTSTSHEVLHAENLEVEPSPVGKLPAHCDAFCVPGEADLQYI